MGETVDADDLSVRDALETIERTRSFEEPLRRRTEGVTWMVWGLVTAGIQLSLSSIQDFFRASGVEGGFMPPDWYWALVLFGWPILGLLMTRAVWRIAQVQTPSLKRSGWRSLLGGLLWLPLVYAAWGIIFLLGPGLPEALYPMVSIGAAWLALGVLDVFQATPVGRRMLIVIGTVILAAGLLAALLMEPAGRGGRLTFGQAAPMLVLVAGGAPFFAGLYQSLRG